MLLVTDPYSEERRSGTGQGVYLKSRAAALRVIAAVTLVWVLAGVVGPDAQEAEAGVPSVRVPLGHDTMACEEYAPATLSSSGVTDNGEKISLDVLVLLDGLSTKRGVEVMTKAATAYLPLGIRLQTKFRRVAFASDGNEKTPGAEEAGPTGEIDRLFVDVIETMGHERPRGTDVVYLLTNKDIFYDDADGRIYDIAGVAYCIGGVRFADAAFAMGEGRPSLWENRLNDRTFSAKVAAHEIGHVMGAQHHYGNCAEGDRSTEGGGEPSLCTVMWPSTVAYMSLKFGTLESSVIRGHAVQFASP